MRGMRLMSSLLAGRVLQQRTLRLILSNLACAMTGRTLVNVDRFFAQQFFHTERAMEKSFSKMSYSIIGVELFSFATQSLSQASIKTQRIPYVSEKFQCAAL